MYKNTRKSQNYHTDFFGESGYFQKHCSPADYIAKCDIDIAANSVRLQEMQLTRAAIAKKNNALERIEKSSTFANIGILAFDAMLFMTGHVFWLGAMVLGGNVILHDGIRSVDQRLRNGRVPQDTSLLDREIKETISVIEILKKNKKLAEDMLHSRAKATSREMRHSMDLNECYKLLECSPTATDKEVKNAYWKLAREYHADHLDSVDLGPHLRHDAEEKLKKINEAYETIMKSRGIR